LVILAVLSAGCGKKGTAWSETDTSTAFSEKELEGLDEDIKQIAESAGESVKKDDTSLTKIMQALEDGRITESQSVMLTLLYSFDPNNLPSEYQSNAENEPTDSALMYAEWWLNENWDSLTEEEKEAFLPFYVSPDDTRSFHYPGNKNKEQMLKKIEVIPSVQAAEPAWKYITIELNPEPLIGAVIYYPNNGNASMLQRAQWANESIRKAWPMFKSLLAKQPTQVVFMYLTDVNGGTGEASMKTIANAKRCRIYVSKHLNEKKTKSTTSHELFHCFQFYIPLKYDTIPRRWMMEATAEWSEHYVWPDYNVEWSNLPDFFSGLDNTLINWDGSWEYNTYMWYLFNSQKVSAGRVAEDLSEASTKDPKEVVAKNSYFPSMFADYALWNWNQEPEIIYQDAPKFPTGTVKGHPMYPNGEAVDVWIRDSKKKEFRQMTIAPLSMGYDVHVFKDPIEKVKFDFSEEGNDLHRRQALIKIGNAWHWEDWTTLKEKTFCRTRDEEKVKSVVLIGTNADSSDGVLSATGYEVDTTGECTPEWHGHTKWSWKRTRSDNFPANAFAKASSQTYSQESSMVSYDTLVEDAENGEFLIKTQSITYSFNEKQLTKYTDSCGIQSHLIESTWKGSKSSSWEIDENDMYNSDAPTRLSAVEEGSDTYDADVDAHDYSSEWVSINDINQKVYKPCEFEGAFTPTAHKPVETDTYIGASDRFKTEPNDIKAERSSDGKRISGSVTQKMGSGGEEWDVLIEVDYRYG
jgi:hypothetical protein